MRIYVEGETFWSKRRSERLGIQASQIEIEKEKGKDKFYPNVMLGIEVKTGQEKDAILPIVSDVHINRDVLNGAININYI